MAAQRRDLDVPDVDAVNEYLPLLNVVVAADEGEYRCLSRPGRADKRNGLFGIDVERDAAKHPFAGIVCKPHIAELDLAADRLKLDGIRLVDELGLHVEDGEYLLSRGKRGLECIELLCERLNRVEEARDVEIERHEDAAVYRLSEEHGLLDIAASAEVEEAQNRGDVEHIDRRTEYAEDEDLMLLCTLETVALFEEFLHFGVLAVEDLCDLHSREVFGKICVDVRRLVLHGAENAARERAENDGEQHEERDKAQDHQRQHVVEQQHRREHTDDDEDVSYHVHEDVGEHH